MVTTCESVLVFMLQPFSVVHDVLRVELIHMLGNGRQFKTADCLIQQGFADDAEESELSKVRTSRLE